MVHPSDPQVPQYNMAQFIRRWAAVGLPGLDRSELQACWLSDGSQEKDSLAPAYQDLSLASLVFHLLPVKKYGHSSEKSLLADKVVGR